MNGQYIRKGANRVRRIVGEVISQMLNVPVLSGLLITFFFLSPAQTLPNRLAGLRLGAALPEHHSVVQPVLLHPRQAAQTRRALSGRQRIASFVFMIVSYPLGFLVLRLTHAPRIFEAVASPIPWSRWG